ncbi:MAG: hypothetical protein AABX26_02895 [Nanoarchaeota archaeon]
MGLFGFGGKSGDVVDLAERHRQKKEREASASESDKKSDTKPFSFFDSEGDAGEEALDSSEGGNSEERKRKLAKRIIDMTNKLDDISNKIYHLQQRIELLERKSNINQS